MWRPPAPYTVVADPTLWSHRDLRTVPTEQRPPVVSDDHHVETTSQTSTVVRVGPVYSAAAVHAALDEGDGLHMALSRGSVAESRRRLGERRWIPPRRDLAAAQALVDQGHDAALTRAAQTELCWDTRLCHGLLIWRWARRHQGAARLLADLRGLAEQMYTAGQSLR